MYTSDHSLENGPRVQTGIPLSRSHEARVLSLSPSMEFCTLYCRCFGLDLQMLKLLTPTCIQFDEHCNRYCLFRIFFLFHNTIITPSNYTSGTLH
jgi:hypothetical protein